MDVTSIWENDDQCLIWEEVQHRGREVVMLEVTRILERRETGPIGLG